MASILRFLRRRRRQPKGRATSQTAFFNQASGLFTTSGESFFTSGAAFVQPKLTVNQPDDAREQEADKMAEHVVQRVAMKPDEEKIQRKGKHDPDEDNVQRKTEDETIQKKEASNEEKPVQRKEDEEQPIHKKPTATATPSAAPVSAHQLSSTKGQGSPLPTNTLAEMSQAFGYDFRNVRIHTTSQAEQLNHDLQAQAFTHGKDVYFSAGKYNPETTDGKRLLAHELTHVVQQSGSPAQEVQRYPVRS